MKGVKKAKWNPHTREVTVIYDANVTSARNIKHHVSGYDSGILNARKI